MSRSDAAPGSPDALWTAVDRLRCEWDVLRHPFYERWTAGELRRWDLQRYAREYRHAVAAIAVASERAADGATGPFAGELRAHAREERDHIALWHAFAEGAGACDAGTWPDEEPLAQTLACRRAWSGDARPGDVAGHLVRLYAIESAQPEISRVKLEGLREHYGFEAGPSTAYFRVHAERDHAHAALARGAAEELVAGADRAELAEGAEAAYRSYWELLDGLEELAEA